MIFKSFRRATALTLVMLMLCVMFPVQALAAQENTPKEEVIYVNLNSDGTVKDIHVVNIFNLLQAGTIVDYGSYENLRNMTSTSPVDYRNNTVTIQADAGKLYYEGKLKSDVIPWNIDIRYFMDGKEYSPAEVAGKSGALKITLDITRNEKCNSNFYDAFALQVSLTLDTAKCSNIVAADATVANVGRNKQLTHTILPGNGAHLEITADVKDFTMDGIAINGIPLNLKVDVGNMELMDQVDQLLNAIAQLDDGAEDLHAGITSFQEGIQQGLAGGMNSLYYGAKKLEAGALELQTGGTTLRDGAEELKTGVSTLNEGIQTLNDGIQKMQTALNTLNAESATLVNGSDAYLAGLTLLQDTLNSMSVTSEDLSALTDASAKILDGLTQLVAGAEALEANVSFEALKRIMAENGLDVDVLKSNNSTAMGLLRQSIDENKEFAEVLKALGYDVSGLFAQLEQVILLLGANNAFIDGTGLYLDTIGGKMSELAYNAALLQTNYALFDAEIIKLAKALGSLAESMGMLTGAVNTLASEYRKIDNGIGAYTGAVAEIVAAYSEIANGSAQLASGGQELEDGSATLCQGTSDLLSGIVELYNGSVSLRDGAGQMNLGVAELLSGIAQIYDGSSALENGTSTMREETAGIEGSINDQIDDMLSEITGGNVEIGSFVSEENTNVESVQFVIKTAAIQNQAQVENEQVGTQELTFWQKLLKLFGIGK